MCRGGGTKFGFTFKTPCAYAYSLAFPLLVHVSPKIVVMGYTWFKKIGCHRYITAVKNNFKAHRYDITMEKNFTAGQNDGPYSTVTVFFYRYFEDNGHDFDCDD